MPALPALVRPCIDEAVSRASAMLNRAVEHAVEMLEQEQRAIPPGPERQRYSTAVREMHMQRLGWRVRFPQLLRETLENPPRPRQAAGMVLRPSSLTLVDDADVEESIESARLTLELAGRVERPLAELDTLMSSALGLDGVQPDSNPLRPEVLTHALRAVLAESPGEAASTGLWMRHMATPLAEDLSDLYRACATLLTNARVQKASYRVVTAPGALGRASQPAALAPQGPARAPGGPAAGPGPAPGRRAGLSGFADLVVNALRGPQLAEFLYRGGGSSAQAPLDTSYYAHIDREIAALEAQWDEAPQPEPAERYAHLPAVDRPVRDVGTATPLSRTVWGELGAPRQRSLVRTRLKKQAQSVGQVMGLELVRQLVDEVARDPRLLAPVREAIVALEPSLARLALKSPRFFGEATHPARHLVERVAERSFRYNDEFNGAFQAFFAEVSACFKGLDAQGAQDDPQPFAQALEQLEAGWSERDAEDDRQRERLVENVRLAERRQEEAGQIAWTLGQRSDLAGVPAVVQEFLFGPWALVMAQARLQDANREIDPGGYGAVVSDLLWSVKPECALKDLPRAFELIPRVVVRLRAGLDMIGQPVSDNDPFFAALERLHRPVLKLRAKHRKQTLDLPKDVPGDALPAAADAAPAAAEELLWLAPDELQEFGFEDTLPSDFAELAAAPAGPAIVTPGHADAIIAGLREGCWVDLYSRNDWHRARLHWASANAALFMFMSHGSRPHSMTRRTLQRLLVNRLLRVVEGHEVVQHAIETLAQREPDPGAAAANYVQSSRAAPLAAVGA